MRSMRWALTGVALVLVSCSGGSSASNSEVSPSPTDAGGVVVYKVGDTGPGGGIIFYVDEAGFDNYSGDDTSIGDMCLMDTCHYLEVAPTVLEGEYSWDDAIVAAESFSTPLANDWLLPSRDALNAMCKYAFGDTVNVICNESGDGSFVNNVGNFSSDFYWSSSEFDGNTAWYQLFTWGGQDYGGKDYTYYVRPVRAF